MLRLTFYFLVVIACVLGGKMDDLQGQRHEKVVVCYVAAWATYRPGAGSFKLDHLDPSLCTHLIYSFAGLDKATSNIKSLDPYQDLEKDYGKNGYKVMVSLKKRYPHLKVTLAIGGWNEGSLTYSLMAEDPEKRRKFVNSVMNFLNNYGFDGLDLDWEYPGRRDGRPMDKANYVLLVKELKEEFDKKGYILTAAVGAGKETIDVAYDLPKLSKYLDFIHLMCYDYHGTWDQVVGANAPLKSLHDGDVLSVEYTIKYMLSHGVSPYKLVLGLPMYGRTFILTDSETKDVVFGSTPVQSQGFKGPFTNENGFMGYNEICLEMYNNSSEWTEHWDEATLTPYLRNKEKVISYDNLRSIASKIKMSVDYGLGGLMVWSIDTDDFLGECATHGDAYQDFLARASEMNQDPVIKTVLERLNLKTNSRNPAYVDQDGQLTIQLPPQHSDRVKFPVMRLINEATDLAMQEKRIETEIERVVKENEIDVDEKPGGSSARHSASLLLLGLLVLLVRF